MDHKELLKRSEEKENKVKIFSEILNTLESTANKKKALWKEIYENSITDRENAYILFHEAYSTMMNSSAEHVTVGPILNKYLERMNKANDQLLKLAELIAKAEEHSTKIDTEDLFSKIKEN